MSVPEEIKIAAEVLVGVAAIAAIPGAASAGTAVAVGSGLWDLYSRRSQPSDLTNSVVLALKAELKSPAIARVTDANVLLPQMVKVATPDPGVLTQAGWDADTVAAEMRKRVQQVATDPAHMTLDVLGAFEQWIAAGLRPLLSDADFAQNAAPDIVRAMFARFDNIGAKVDNFGAQVGNFFACIDDINSQRREILEAIALRFGELAPEDKTKDELKAFLFDKAKDYRALRAEIAAIDDGLKQLSALKAAAAAAMDEGDLGKVESLLAQVHVVQLEEAARTSELRAENALLRGLVEDAHALFSAAADSFAGHNSMKSVQRRVDGANRLVRYGETFGGEATRYAGDMAQAAIDSLGKAGDPMLRVEAYRVLGEAKKGLAHRHGGISGLLHLSEAADAFSAALSVPGGFASVEVTALTLAQFARVQVLLAHHWTDDRAEAVDRYKTAQDAFRESLKYLHDAKHKQTRAFVTVELAQALFSDGLVREDKAEKRTLFRSAEQEASTGVALLDAIMDGVRFDGTLAGNRSKAAILVAEARFHDALGRLDFDDPDKEAALQGRLKEAIGAYASAIDLFPKQSHPARWATNLLNLASLEDMNATLAFASPEKQLDAYTQAANLRTAVLEIFTWSDFPVQRAKALNGTAQCLVSISENPLCPDPRQRLETARDLVDEVIRVCWKTSMSVPLRDAKALSVDIRAALAAL